MTVRRGSATAIAPIGADEVFALLTDPSRLPEWNRIMTELSEAPPSLSPGCQWVVGFKAMRVMRWQSRSWCEEIDAEGHRLVYRSGTDDGNPSYALWTWVVEDRPDGTSQVRVEWELHPKTFLRRHPLSRVRNWMLRQEVPASLQELGAAAAASRAG